MAFYGISYLQVVFNIDAPVFLEHLLILEFWEGDLQLWSYLILIVIHVLADI